MKGKAYPNDLPREESGAKGIWYQKWQGCASAILTQEEVSHLQSVVDDLLDGADISEALSDEGCWAQEAINGILANGEGRMHALHGVLGGFDLSPDGKVSKPESERIKWEDHSPRQAEPNLKLIKTEGNLEK